MKKCVYFVVTLVSSSIAFCALSTPAFAKETPASVRQQEFATVSISDILNHPVDDQKVSFSGKITRVKGNDKYVISDGESHINVDLAGKLHKQVAFTVGQNVAVTGKVQVGAFNPTPDIKAYSIVAQ